MLKKYKGLPFTRKMMEEMFEQTMAIPYKRYHGMMTKVITHLFRYECVLFCYLWRDGAVPIKGKLRGEEAAHILQLFEEALDRRGIKWDCCKCKTPYGRSQDDFRYKFTGLRLIPDGIRVSLLFPSNVNKI